MAAFRRIAVAFLLVGVGVGDAEADTHNTPGEAMSHCLASFADPHNNDPLRTDTGCGSDVPISAECDNHAVPEGATEGYVQNMLYCGSGEVNFGGKHYYLQTACESAPDIGGDVAGWVSTGSTVCYGGCQYEANPNGGGPFIDISFNGGNSSSGYFGNMSATGQTCADASEPVEEPPEVCSIDDPEFCAQPNPPSVCIEDATTGQETCVEIKADGCQYFADGSAQCGCTTDLQGLGTNCQSGGNDPPDPETRDEEDQPPGNPPRPPDTTPEVDITINNNGDTNTEIEIHNGNENPPPGTCSGSGCDTNGDGTPDVPPGTCTDPNGCGGNTPGTCADPGGCSDGAGGEVPPGTCTDPNGCDNGDGGTNPPGTCTNPEGCGGSENGTCTNPLGCDGDMEGTCTNPNGCDGGSSPPGTCMDPDGCDGTPPGSCTRPGGCESDGVCDPATEECGEDGTAAGGTDCDSAPSCSGDEISCMIAFQSWAGRCATQSITDLLNPEDDGAGEWDPGDPDEVSDVVKEEPTVLNEVLDAAGFLGNSAACPVFAAIPVLGGNAVALGDQGFQDGLCDMLKMAGIFVLVMGYLLSARIAIGGG